MATKQELELLVSEQEKTISELQDRLDAYESGAVPTDPKVGALESQLNESLRSQSELNDVLRRLREELDQVREINVSLQADNNHAALTIARMLREAQSTRVSPGVPSEDELTAREVAYLLHRRDIPEGTRFRRVD